MSAPHAPNPKPSAKQVKSALPREADEKKSWFWRTLDQAAENKLTAGLLITVAATLWTGMQAAWDNHFNGERKDNQQIIELRKSHADQGAAQYKLVREIAAPLTPASGAAPNPKEQQMARDALVDLICRTADREDTKDKCQALTGNEKWTQVCSAPAASTPNAAAQDAVIVSGFGYHLARQAVRSDESATSSRTSLLARELNWQRSTSDSMLRAVGCALLSTDSESATSLGRLAVEESGKLVVGELATVSVAISVSTPSVTVSAPVVSSLRPRVYIQYPPNRKDTATALGKYLSESDPNVRVPPTEEVEGRKAPTAVTQLRFCPDSVDPELPQWFASTIKKQTNGVGEVSLLKLPQRLCTNVRVNHFEVWLPKPSNP